MMRTIQAARPRRELSEFVRSFAQREVTCADAGFEQQSMASLESILSFNFQHRETIEYPNGRRKQVAPLQIVGPQSFPSGRALFSGNIVAFGIFLRPLAIWRLFRIPAHILADSDMAGEDLLHGRETQNLWHQLADSCSFAERIRVAEEYLLPFASNALARTPVMKSAHHLFRQRGATRIDELARQSALSVRQYERRFAQEIGMAPKRFARITRFQMALDAKRVSPLRSWLSVAHEFGYSDQMHMIREFQGLGGNAPGLLIQQCGDLQPWSLTSEKTLHL